jgi:CheY-like chemotaxis protein
MSFSFGAEPLGTAAMSGKRAILIVEDEPLIAMMLEDFLETLGHEVVATCETLGEALKWAGEGGFDLAIIDVQLREGEKVWPMADRLADEGTPFILATGGHVEDPPERHRAVPMLLKPYTIDSIELVLEQVAGS